MSNRPPQGLGRLSAPVYKGPIPQCEGPKLEEFSHRRATVDYRALLSDPESDGQAHVFEVRIGSRNYALKIFKFYDDGEHVAALLDYQRDFISLDMLHAHADPFYNECRAYGRLKQKGLDGKVAIRCHGYTTVPPMIESMLEERFNVTDWGRDDYDKPMKERAAFRAIVKDLVREDPPLTHRLLKKMLKDLAKIRGQRVYPLDIMKRNYKGGLLMDFSNAITEPNYLFDIQPEWQVESYKNQDLIQFDSMIEEENIKTPLRALPNLEVLKKLRPRGRLQEKYGWSTPSMKQL